MAANLLTDDVLMRSYQLTPEYRPLVDLHTDLAPTQGNKGWFFGYSDALVGSTASFRPFKYEAHGNGQLQDGRWMVREVCTLPDEYIQIGASVSMHILLPSISHVTTAAPMTLESCLVRAMLCKSVTREKERRMAVLHCRLEG